MEKRKILVANIILIIALILFMVFPTMLSKIFIFMNFTGGNATLIISGITSVTVLGGGALLFSKLTKQKFKLAMGIKRISFRQTMLSILMGIGAYICGVGINFISMSLIPSIVKDGMELSSIITGGNFFITLVVVVLIPAFFEEVFFRGIFIGAYNSINKKLAFFLITAIFATFHGNLMQLIYVMFLGYILIYARKYTDSLVGAMVLHGTNNGIAFILSQLMLLVQNVLGNSMTSTLEQTSEVSGISIGQAFLAAPIFFLVGGTLIFIAVRGLKNYKEEMEIEEDFEEDTIDHIEKSHEEVNGKMQWIILALYFIVIITMVAWRYI